MIVIQDALLSDVVGRDRNCFFCGKDITFPAILWAGATADILIHAECAVELGLRLGRDALEVEHITDRYLTGRTVAELRERLIAEEERR